MADRRRSWLVFALALTLALSGCGISTTGTTDEGDGLEAGTGLTDSEVRPPPSPDNAGSAEGLVLDYLQAASGGPTQVKAFLTENALKTFQDPVNKDNPPLTIVHLVGPPQVGALIGTQTTPVIVNYRVVGTLTDQGQVEQLVDFNQHSMTFLVLPDAQKPSLRIDGINSVDGLTVSDLMLSDQAMTDPAPYYRIQPIYFWDDQTNPANSALVPDLRYLPLTITADQRASRVVQYLAAGPSRWLTGVMSLPPGTATGEPVTSQNGTLVVKVTAAAAAAGEAGLKRLLYQLQWSLSTPNRTPTIALQIDDKIVNVNVGANDYQAYNLSSTFQNAPQRYDLTAEGKVVTIPAAAPQGVLAAPENQNVASAAISRRGDVAVYVHNVPGGRSLQIVHANGNKVTVNPPAGTFGRPAFTSSNGDLLVPANGRLYAVTAAGALSDITPRNVSNISGVSVAPDARRVAFVANGQVYVSSLNGNAVGAGLRSILSGQFVATSVAWTNESWLIVAGAGALWRVTADGVVAEDLSGKLLGLTVNELLAYPQWPARTNTDVLAISVGRGSYSFFSSMQQEPFNLPFFGS